MATRIFLVLIMAILILMIATFSLSLVEKEEIALIENQEGKSLNIIDDLYDIEGNQIPLESLLEGKVLLNVWASWCITCLVEHPFLKSITATSRKCLFLAMLDSIQSLFILFFKIHSCQC